MSFETRSAAGRALVPALMKFKTQNPVVLALPRGGVAVAAEVATALGAELDLVLVRKVGVPEQPELAMGAVVNGGAPIIVRNEDVIGLSAVSDAEFAACCQAELAEIDRRRAVYLRARERTAVGGRVAIIIDDGVATGTTVRAALRATRLRKPSRLVFAVPVGPQDTIEALQAEVDEVICVEIHKTLGSVGFYYDDFHQMTDREVIDLLRRSQRGSSRRKATPA
jgi:putative phosphoribosyl transferase